MAPTESFAALIAAIRNAAVLPSPAIPVLISGPAPNVHPGKVEGRRNEIRYLSIPRYQVPAVGAWQEPSPVRNHRTQRPTYSTSHIFEAYLRSGRALVLTDDFAPVDQLLAALFVERGSSP